MTIEIPKEKWTGYVREITIGATSDEGGTRANTLTVGGESSLPFLYHEGSFPNKPALAVEVLDKRPDDWSPLLLEAWGEAINDPGSWAKAAEEAGADAVSLINTLLGMAIDIHTRQPMLANITGGLSGPAVRPVAVRMVWQVAAAVSIPVIGMGGIMTTEDALEFIIAGANAVAPGTANFINPLAAVEIISGIEDFMIRNDICNVSDLVGSLQRPDG